VIEIDNALAVIRMRIRSGGPPDLEQFAENVTQLVAAHFGLFKGLAA
jgi:hypothetical protein